MIDEPARAHRLTVRKDWPIECLSPSARQRVLTYRKRRNKTDDKNPTGKPFYGPGRGESSCPSHPLLSGETDQGGRRLYGRRVLPPLGKSVGSAPRPDTSRQP